MSGDTKRNSVPKNAGSPFTTKQTLAPGDPPNLSWNDSMCTTAYILYKFFSKTDVERRAAAFTKMYRKQDLPAWYSRNTHKIVPWANIFSQAYEHTKLLKGRLSPEREQLWKQIMRNVDMNEDKLVNEVQEVINGLRAEDLGEASKTRVVKAATPKAATSSGGARKRVEQDEQQEDVEMDVDDGWQSDQMDEASETNARWVFRGMFDAAKIAVCSGMKRELVVREIQRLSKVVADPENKLEGPEVTAEDVWK